VLCSRRARGRCAPRMRRQEMISLSRMDLRGFIAIGQGCAVFVCGTVALAGRQQARQGAGADASGRMDDLVLVLELDLKLQLCPARLVDYCCYATLRASTQVCTACHRSTRSCTTPHLLLFAAVAKSVPARTLR
jgi:hypothetical protein